MTTIRPSLATATTTLLAICYLFSITTASVNAFAPSRGLTTAFIPRSIRSAETTGIQNVDIVLAQQQQQQRQNAAALRHAVVAPTWNRNGRLKQLFMGWGPEPVWSTATVEGTESACESGRTVTLLVRVPAETAAQYQVPGQYVQVRKNEAMDKPLFLAIASAPNSENNVFEFLVKKTENNEWLTNAKTPVTLQMSQVLGNGFPMAENLEGFKYDFPTQNVLLFATGSGLAPIKAAMESGLLLTPGGGRTARLYYGERTAADLCCVEQFSAWEQAGYQIVPVLSQPELLNDKWQGRTGYVQNALEEDGIAIPRNTGALLCGQKGMFQAVKDLLLKAGVFEGRVLSNF